MRFANVLLSYAQPITIHKHQNRIRSIREHPLRRGASGVCAQCTGVRLWLKQPQYAPETDRTRQRPATFHSDAQKQTAVRSRTMHLTSLRDGPYLRNRKRQTLCGFGAVQVTRQSVPPPSTEHTVQMRRCSLVHQPPLARLQDAREEDLRLEEQRKSPGGDFIHHGYPRTS